MIMTNSDHIRNFIALWNTRDLDAILNAMAPDCVYHNMPWPPLIGHEAIRQGLALFVADAQAIDWQLLHIAETPNGAIMTERLDRFQIRDAWVEMPVMGIFELHDGQITHWRDYFDAAQFQSAMAAIG